MKVSEGRARARDGVHIDYSLHGDPAAPREMVVRMNEVLVKGLKEVLDRFAAIGAEVLPTTPEAFAAFIRAEHARWGEVIRRAGIKVEL
jgi:tripartite-type tricarboxylate transporter receptor subunit TctC